MMNKAEQEAYDRALRCERIYKDEIEILTNKINNVIGFCTIIASEDSDLKSEKAYICKQILRYLK